MSETMREYLARYRTQYNAVAVVRCKVLDCEVRFTSAGFKHLVFKGAHRRANSVIKSRLKLIALIVPVLKNATEIVETRIRKEIHYGAKREVKYQALEAIVSKSKVRVRVVVRTIGEKGVPHFYSVMKY